MSRKGGEIPIGYGATLGARAVSGLPKLGLAPFAMVWIRLNGSVIWVWDSAVGSA
jgi:hypothetical protein